MVYDNISIKINISKRAKVLRLKMVFPLKLVITIPYYLKSSYDANNIIKKYATWINKTAEKQIVKAKELLPHNYLNWSSSEKEEYIKELKIKAKGVLSNDTEYLANKYGFSYKRLAIKHNKSNWGSCSRKNNINLNINLVRLPKELRYYVILHELSHLKYFNHGLEFHKLLNSLCLAELGIEEKILEKAIKNYPII